MNDNIICNRYRIINPLGSGNMGDIFLVEDLLKNRLKIALKIIKKSIINEKYVSDIINFKHEFEAMSCLRHPNLISVYDFGFIESTNQYFITMEYLDGLTLKEKIAHYNAQGTVCTKEEIYPFMVDTCRALSYIHARGILHRDINPGNIMIKDEWKHVKIMDFGLADLADESRHVSKGTLLYIAPEVAKKDVGTYTDIFSLGLTYYEMITGKSFYHTYNSRQIISLIKEEVAFDLHKQKAFKLIDNPQLRSILERMITFTPERRYTSCMEIIKDMNRFCTPSYELESRETKDAYVYGAGFVGRDEELHYLKDFNTNTDIFALLVHGNAGIGKSRLIYEYKKYCQLNNILFIEGSCYEHQVRLYSPFLPILDQCILRTADSILAEYGGQLKKILPHHIRLADIQADSVEEPAEESAALIENISNYILHCTTYETCQTVIFLNDVHWADEASLDILHALIKKKAASIKTDKGLKIIILSRNEGLEKLEKLHAYTIYKELPLKPFDKNNVSNYITAIFGKGMITRQLQDAVPFINRKVGGNPFFLQALIKSMVNNKQIVRNDIPWDLNDTIETVDIPDNLNQLVINRLHYLNLIENETRVLEIVCMLDKKISIEELSRITDVTNDMIVLFENYELLNKEVYEDAIYYTVAHDLIKEMIVSNIAHIKSKHEQLARKLESIYTTAAGTVTSDNYVDELAYHYFQAANKSKALSYLEQAAAIAAKKFVHTKASTLYNQMITLLDTESDRQKRLEILYMLSDSYRILWRHEDFRTVTAEALTLAQQIGDKKYSAKINLTLSRHYTEVFDIQKSMEYLKKALALFEALDDKKGLLYAYNRLGSNYYILNDHTKAMEYYKKSLDISREVNDKQGIAFATGNTALVLTDFAEYDKAVENMNTLIDICNAIGNKKDEALGNFNLGEIYEKKGDFEKSLAAFEKAVTISMEIGNPGFTNKFLSSKSIALFHLGRVDEAEKLNTKCLPLLEHYGLEIDILNARMLKAKIRFYRKDTQTAITILKDLLTKNYQEEDIARINYELWKITSESTYKDASLVIFKKLYDLFPKVLYKKYIDDMETKGCKNPPSTNYRYYYE